MTPETAQIVQAITAVFTLFAMVYLGWRQKELTKQQVALSLEQKELTRRQINLSLYEKRYRIYQELEELIGHIFTQGLPKEKESIACYMKKCGQYICDFKSNRRDREFLLDDKMNKSIDDILERIETTLTKIAEIYSSGETFYSNYNNANTDFWKTIMNTSSEAHQKFKECLDFRKI